jgi:hypothetical protein
MSSHQKDIWRCSLTLLIGISFIVFLSSCGSEPSSPKKAASEKAKVSSAPASTDSNSKQDMTGEQEGAAPVTASTQEAGCLSCHKGIESIGGGLKQAVQALHNGLACGFCHKGDDKAATKEAAHDGLLPNPTALDVVEQTCGMCHRAHVERVKKSLHATMAGMISSTSYAFAAQKEKNAQWATYVVEDTDGTVPKEKGAVEKLEQLPTFSQSNNPGHDYLRNQCLRCHLWTEGKKTEGDYRSSGCAACHVLYDDNGLSKSADPTIPKDKPDHPIKHQLTTKIPPEQCIHCHNRGGRTGVSFIGTMEADPYGSPWTAEGGKQGKLHGKFYNHLTPDVHHQRGMSCIDCHTSSDLHGDGNIYSKKEQAVEIRCSTCHGEVDKAPSGKTAWGNPLPNLATEGGQLVLTAKLTGKKHAVPNVKALADAGKLHPAMLIAEHQEELECYACHARWAPQCYGCHTKMDMRKRANDWISGGKEDAYQWKENRSYLRWETPVLGINHRGKVSPFIPGCQVFLTQIGPDGKTIKSSFVYTTSDGHAGTMLNQIQPHTISKEARACMDCHGNTKALGLGSGFYNPKANKLPIDFELERIVDEEGRQIQATAHMGSRPLNKEEQAKVSRVGACLGCHAETDQAFWGKVRSTVGDAPTDELHREVIEKVLQRAVR